MESETISVSIEAQGAETRQLVASLIAGTLSEAGFKDIDVGIASRDDATSTVVDRDHMPSLLDQMRAENPQVFDRPVRLLAMPYSQDVAEETVPHLTLLKDRQVEDDADTPVIEAINNLELVV